MLNPVIDWRTSGAAPALAGASVHVWFASLDRSDEVVRGLAENISLDEYERATRFRFQRDRNRWIAARAFLRQILAGYLGCKPGDFSFRYGAFGKPVLTGAFAESEIRFNVSHSGGGVLVGVAHGREVGVDLEVIRPLGDVRGLARSCFSVSENAAWEALREHDRLRAFFDGWTRKEAYLKAVGKGLSLSLDAFEVSLDPGPGPRKLSIYQQQHNPSGWTLVSLAPRSDYSAALVVEGRDCLICNLSAGWMAAEPAASPGGCMPYSLRT